MQGSEHPEDGPDTGAAPSEPSVFEWIRRGDGEWALYRSGVRVDPIAEPDVYQEHLAERPA